MRVALLFFAFQAFALALSAQANSACKDITIVGPAGITAPGGTMVLKVNAVTPLPANSKYEWSVSAGTITSGQGTSSIEVLAPPDGSAVSVRATVNIPRLVPPCNGIVSEEFALAPHHFVCGLPDTYEKLKRNDERVRLYSAGLRLSRNPGNVLMFVIYLAPTESTAQANRRAAFIRNFFINDKLVTQERIIVPSDQLYLAFVRSDQTRTSIFLIPPTDVTDFLKSFNASLVLDELDSPVDH